MDKRYRHLTLFVVCALACAGVVQAQEPPPDAAADEAYRLAVGLHNIPLYKEAVTGLQTFLDRHPQDPRVDGVLYRLGDCHVHLKAHAAALKAFEQVVAKHPDSPLFAESLFRVAELNQFLGHDAKAAAAYESFLAKFPEHDLVGTVRDKERTARIALLYDQVAKDAGAALELATTLAPREDRVGEEALYVASTITFNQKDYARAVPFCKELLTRYPESTHADVARLNAANALVSQGRLEDALVYLAAVKSTRLDEVQYLRGTILAQQETTDKAAAAFQVVVTQHPESRYRPYALFELGVLGQADAWDTLLEETPKGELADEARYRRGAALAEAGKNAEALTLLEAIAADSARRSDAALLMAELRSADDVTGALELVAGLEAKGDVDSARLSRARYAVALSALKAGKATDALKQFTAIVADPKSKDLHADCLYRSGLAHEQLKQVPQAEAAYGKLVEQWPQDKLVPYALLRVAAMTLEKKPDVAKAALVTITESHAAFEHIGQARELFAEIQYRQAWDAYEAKQYAKAAAIFAELREHDVYGAEGAYLAGVCYRNADMPADAEKNFAFLLKAHPTYTYIEDARELLGELLSAQKKWQEAATHYGSYASSIKDPVKRAAAELKQGMALFQLNQAARARESLQYASENGEAAVKARALFFLGELLLMQKKHAEAKDVFLKVGVLYRHDELTPASLLEAAKCMKATGETDSCRSILERLKKEFPQSPHAKEADELVKGL